MSLNTICKKLQFDGPIIKYEILHGGNINTTYHITCAGKNGNKEYLLQRVNKNVFKKPNEVMQNIISVTEFINNKPHGDFCALRFNKSVNGEAFIVDDNGDFWRAREFIDCVCFDYTDNLSVIEEAGVAFGEFQYLLDGFNASNLYETIPNFHNTINRYLNFEESVLNAILERKAESVNEIEFLLKYKEKACALENMYLDGYIPLRVTHNDTKCNNVIFNKNTLKALAVIDLDTIMPGLSAYDFGDGARSISCTTLEDEHDLTKVKFDLTRFEAFTKGYLSHLSKILSKNEIESLSSGVFSMSIELASRFLADYLDGDTYFKTTYNKQNLFRARCQIALCKDILAKEDKIKEIINKYSV